MATVSFPGPLRGRCRLRRSSCLASLSAGVPVEVFIDNVIELLDEDLKRRGAAPLDTGWPTNCNVPAELGSTPPKTLDGSASGMVPPWCWPLLTGGILCAAAV